MKYSLYLQENHCLDGKTSHELIKNFFEKLYELKSQYK